MSTRIEAMTDYAAKQAHVELAERMKQRDAGTLVLVCIAHVVPDPVLQVPLPRSVIVLRM